MLKVQLISEAIAVLLENHSCVVWSGFGGFVTNPKPSEINEAKGLIYPPGRSLSFNVHLQNNDGLLAQFVAAQDKLSYAEALVSIEHAAEILKEQLRDKQSVNLNALGVLHLSDEGALEFEPHKKVWADDASFGLPVVGLPNKLSVAPVVVKEEKKAAIAPVIAPIEEPQQLETPKEISIVEGKKRKRSPLWAAAMWIPLAIGAGYLLHAGMDSNGSQLASLNPFKGSPCIGDYVPRYTEEKFAIEWSDNAGFEDYVKAHPSVEQFRYDFDKEEPSPTGIRVKTTAPKISSTTPVAKTTAAISASKLGMHFIVAGAFREENNATKLVRKLRQQGFDATVFSHERGLHHVSYGSYTNRDSANVALATIKAKENAQAWIKKH